MDFSKPIATRNQFVCRHPENGVELWIKREDEIHPVVSGNKYRKLKYNILDAKAKSGDKLLTFGGAYSNHIAATAAAANYHNLKSVGVIRGDELGKNRAKTLSQNRTLNFAAKNGMEFCFISRQDYRRKGEKQFLEQLKNKFGSFYHIPEGGSNSLAVKGCEEILKNGDEKFDRIAAPVGTGGTFAGLINSSFDHQKVIGFPALKAGFLGKEIRRWSERDNWSLNEYFHFGGYAKVNTDLIEFINDFYDQYAIPLDPVYTGKMIYGIFNVIYNDIFPDNSKVLAVHTGGLQGVYGINNKLKNKGLKTIKY